MTRDTIIAAPIASGQPDLLIVRAAYGSHPWYAVPYTGPTTNRSPALAVWVNSGDREVSERATDGQVRFFTRKGLLLAAIC